MANDRFADISKGDYPQIKESLDLRIKIASAESKKILTIRNNDKCPICGPNNNKEKGD